MRVVKVMSVAIVAILVAVLSGCSKQPQLSGEVPFADSVQLVLLDMGQQNPSPVDTAIVTAGRFSFGSKQFAEGVYLMLMPERRQLEVYLSSDPLVVKVHGDESGLVEASQSKHSALLNEYYAANASFKKVGAECSADYEALKRDTAAFADMPESEREAARSARQKEIMDRWEAAYTAYQGQVLELASRYPNHAFTLHLYSSLIGNVSPEQFKAIDEALQAWNNSLDTTLQMQHLKEFIAREKKTAEGCTFTDFVAQDVQGNDVHLSDVAGRGKVVLLEFWASWCGYCRRANPALVEVYKKFSPKGFEVFGLSLDRSKDDWQKAYEADKLPWPQYISQAMENGPADLYNVSGIPFNVLIDGEGVIVAKGLDPDELSAKLAEKLP